MRKKSKLFFEVNGQITHVAEVTNSIMKNQEIIKWKSANTSKMTTADRWEISIRIPSVME